MEGQIGGLNDRMPDWMIVGLADWRTEEQKYRLNDRQANTEQLTDELMKWQTAGEIDRLTDGEMDEWTDRQIDKQIDLLVYF